MGVEHGARLPLSWDLDLLFLPTMRHHGISCIPSPELSLSLSQSPGIPVVTASKYPDDFQVSLYPLGSHIKFSSSILPLQASLPLLFPCPSAEAHNRSTSIQLGPVLGSLKTNVWQVYSFVETHLQQASCVMLPSFCVLNMQVQAYVSQSCLLGMSAVGMQEHTWSWVAIFCAQADSVFNNLVVDSSILYTCDHVIKDFLLPSHVTPLLVCAPMCPKSRWISVYQLYLPVLWRFLAVSLKKGLSFSISPTL